jgi:F1F0 ATPase subunit 2
LEADQRAVSVTTLVQILRDAAPFALLGTIVGAGYFAALRYNVERYLSPRPLGTAVMLHLTRLVLAGIAFALIARAGAVPLLGALLGFLVARALAIRGVRA